MPWMKHKDRGTVYFHPVDVVDAVKDNWVEADPPVEPAPSKASETAPTPPSGASLAGGGSGGSNEDDEDE